MITTNPLVRIVPPVPFTHYHEFQTGKVVGVGHDKYTLALTSTGELVDVPKSWVQRVNGVPETARQARERMAS